MIYIRIINKNGKTMIFRTFIEKMYFFGRSIDFLYLTLSIVCGMFIQ